MECKRVDEYHKYGSNFYGRLVMVDYTKDMQSDPRYGQFGAGVFYKYAEIAEKLARERYGDSIARVLLSIPEFVCELK